MRFLHSFPLPLLLILISLVNSQANLLGSNKTYEKSPSSTVRLSRYANEISLISFDFQAFPHGLNKTHEKSPNSKLRLSRSANESTVSESETKPTNRYEDMSFDQLEKELNAAETQVNNITQVLDIARKELEKKKIEADEPFRDYEQKKKTYEELKKLSDLKDEVEKAEKEVETANDEFSRTNKTVERLEKDMEDVDLEIKNAEKALDDLNNNAKLLQEANDEVARLQTQITTDEGIVKGLKTDSTNKETAVTTAQKKFDAYETTFVFCTPENAGKSECSNMAKLKSDRNTANSTLNKAKSEAVTAANTYAKANGELEKLGTKKIEAEKLAATLLDNSLDLDNLKTAATSIVTSSQRKKQRQVKPLEVAEAAKKSAESKLEKAKERKADADAKVNALPSQDDTDFNLAYAAFLGVEPEHTRLEGELRDIEGHVKELEELLRQANERVGAIKPIHAAKSGGSTSTSSIVWIVPVVLLLIVVVLVIIFLIYKKKMKKRKEKTAVPPKSGEPTPSSQLQPALPVETGKETATPSDQTPVAKSDELKPAEDPKPIEPTKVKEQLYLPIQVGTTFTREHLPTDIPKDVIAIIKNETTEQTPIFRAKTGTIIYPLNKDKMRNLRRIFPKEILSYCLNFELFSCIAFDYRKNDLIGLAPAVQTRNDNPEQPLFSDTDNVLNICFLQNRNSEKEHKRYIIITKQSQQNRKDELHKYYVENKKKAGNTGGNLIQNRQKAGQDEDYLSHFTDEEIIEKFVKIHLNWEIWMGYEARFANRLYSLITGIEEITGEDDSHSSSELATCCSPRAGAGSEMDSKSGSERKAKKKATKKPKKKHDKKSDRNSDSDNSEKNPDDETVQLAQPKPDMQIGGPANEVPVPHGPYDIPSLDLFYQNARRTKAQYSELLLDVISFNRNAKPDENTKQFPMFKFKVEEIMSLLNDIADFLKDEKKKMLVELEDKPKIVYGDLHGSVDALLNELKPFGEIGSKEWRENKIVLLGDYVDRGTRSLDLIMIVFLLWKLYPNTIVLLRGNHESFEVNIHYGFYREMIDRFEPQVGANLHYFFNHVFAFMPLACYCKKDKVLLMHGCVPDEEFFTKAKILPKNFFEAIKNLPKYIPDPTAIPLALAILWNDPAWFIKKCTPGSRGLGSEISEEWLIKLCGIIDVQLVIRAHQVAINGFEFFAGRLLVSIFSCPNYSPLEVNCGAVLTMTQDFVVRFLVFRGAPESTINKALKNMEDPEVVKFFKFARIAGNVHNCISSLKGDTGNQAHKALTGKKVQDTC